MILFELVTDMAEKR